MSCLLLLNSTGTGSGLHLAQRNCRSVYTVQVPTMAKHSVMKLPAATVGGGSLPMLSP
uniref:Uncharacterized protein n=1 Tax=Arundo donax TaxID=35708 RepID=A0A0A9A5Z7_ARUDO